MSQRSISSMDLDPMSESILKTISHSCDALDLLRKMFLEQSELRLSYNDAAELILSRKGRLIVVGVGKSGHIAKKISATLSSTGTHAYFVHPSEAAHGDLGMISRDDTILCFSWSGKSSEFLSLYNYAARFSIPIISITSEPKSNLSLNSSVSIILPRVREACPHGLAPTTSSTLMMVAGDALAMLLLKKNGFTPDMFYNYHPGGNLGLELKKLSNFVMKNELLPIVSDEADMRDAIIVMTKLGRGVVVIVDMKRRPIGIITDGDLRRNMDNSLMQFNVRRVMNDSPKTIRETELLGKAINMMDRLKINHLVLVNADDQVSGIISVHDILESGSR